MSSPRTPQAIAPQPPPVTPLASLGPSTSHTSHILVPVSSSSIVLLNAAQLQGAQLGSAAVGAFRSPPQDPTSPPPASPNPQPQILMFRPVKSAVSKLGRQRPGPVVSPGVVQAMSDLGINARRQRYLLVPGRAGSPGSSGALLEGKPRVDNSSILHRLDRNRARLETKLSLRRTPSQLADAGILPAAGTPPTFAAQRNRLQRAQTGDALRHKIEARPERRELVSQRILPDAGPSLEPGILEKTRQLKRCRLADSLNEKLAARPGPLELVQENILQVGGGLEEAVKEGLVQFKPTSAGTVDKHPHPVFLVQHPSQGHGIMLARMGDGEDGSVSGYAAIQPATANGFKKPKPAPSPNPAKLIKFHEYKDPRSATSSGWCSPGASVEAASPQPPPSVQSAHSSQGASVQAPGPGQGGADGSEETSYDLLLQQQNLFLQWQRELQAKYPGSNIQLVTPFGLPQGHVVVGHSQALGGPGSPNSSTSVSSTSPYSSAMGEASPAAQPSVPQGPQASASWSSDSSAAPEASPAPSQPQAAQRRPPVLIRPPIHRLEDLRVSELKAQCKKRAMLVSGPKPSLVERLRSVEEDVVRETRELLAAAPTEQSASDQPPSDQAQDDADYSSPDIDLSGLSFGQGGQPSGGPQGQGPSLSFPQPQGQPSQPSQGSFTFAAQGSGGQFTAMPADSGPPAPPPPPQTVMETGPPAVQMAQAAQMVRPAGAMDNRAPTPAALAPSASAPSLAGHAHAQQAPPPQHDMPQGTETIASPGLISSSTLSLHEEMLRHQQRKIEELQKELQRAQEQLRHQQHVIQAARKAQSEGAGSGADPSKSELESVAEAWLAHIDTKHLQRFHIQLFLQHKLQQQTHQQMLQAHKALQATHQQLQDEVRVERAVEEVRALLVAEPSTAITILKSLRAPLEAATEQAQASAQPAIAVPETSQATSSAQPTEASSAPTPQAPPKRAVEKRNSAPDPGAAPTGQTVDMEEIFRCVLAAAKEEAAKSPPAAAVHAAAPHSVGSPEELHGDAAHADHTPTQPGSASSGSFTYSKNEAFEDLMEVLRSEEDSQDHFHDASNSAFPDPGPLSTAHDAPPTTYPNTFGSAELDELLGPGWLDLPGPHQSGSRSGGESSPGDSGDWASGQGPPSAGPPFPHPPHHQPPSAITIDQANGFNDLGLADFGAGQEDMEWLDQFDFPPAMASGHRPESLERERRTSNPLLAQSAL